jgi:hypothetical protein
MEGMPKRVLSIDWDYFFPDSRPYDMGHSECHGQMLRDILWNTRASSVNLSTGEPLLETYVPVIPKDFWSLVIGKPGKVYVADSHFKIWAALEPWFLSQVTSLDAHHDCGYRLQKEPYVDCSNWGFWGRRTGQIGRLDLWYPEWRRTNPEGFCGRKREYKPTTTSYGLPAPAEYDIVFICRSGAWTPPWWDSEFLKFTQGPGSWEVNPTFLETVETRGISMEQARAAREQWGELKKMAAGLLRGAVA